MKKGSQDSEETRKHRREALRRTLANPEVEQRRVEGLRRAWDDPERRKQLAEANRRRAADPEAKKRTSEGLRRAWELDPSRRENLSERYKNMWAEYRAKVQAASQPSAKPVRRGGRPRHPESAENAAVIIEARDGLVPQVPWSKMPEFLFQKTGRILSVGGCRSIYEEYKMPSVQPRDATAT